MVGYVFAKDLSFLSFQDFTIEQIIQEFSNGIRKSKKLYKLYVEFKQYKGYNVSVVFFFSFISFCFFFLFNMTRLFTFLYIDNNYMYSSAKNIFSIHPHHALLNFIL